MMVPYPNLLEMRSVSDNGATEPIEQDNRSVVAIDLPKLDAWLHGTAEQAAKLVRLTPVEHFDAAPMPR